MITTARRIGRIAAASAVSAGLLLAGAGPAVADDPGTSTGQGPITLSPEQATWVCTQRIPAILSAHRPGDHPDQRGRDDPWLDGLAHGTENTAKATGHGDVADRIQKRIDARPAKLDRLADAKKRVTDFRDEAAPDDPGRPGPVGAGHRPCSSSHRGGGRRRCSAGAARPTAL